MIIFVFVLSQGMLFSMKKGNLNKEAIDSEVLKEFQMLNLNDNNNDLIDSSSIFDSKDTDRLPLPVRSFSAHVLGSEVNRFQNDKIEKQKKPRFKKNSQSLLIPCLVNNFQKNIIDDKSVLKNHLLTAIKNGELNKLKHLINICSLEIRENLLCDDLGIQGLNATSLLIGLHGKNWKVCKPLLKLLMRKGAQESYGCTFLHTAVFFNCPELVTYLLKNSYVDPLKLGGQEEAISALHCALKYKCFHAAITIIDFYEIQAKKFKKLVEGLKKQKNILKFQKEFLEEYQKKLVICQNMIKQIVNKKDSLLRTPLHYLVVESFNDCAPVELEYNQQVDNINFSTCVSDDNWHGQKIEMVKKLCSLGADVNIQDCFGKTPFYYARESKDNELLQALFTLNQKITIKKRN